MVQLGGAGYEIEAEIVYTGIQYTHLHKHAGSLAPLYQRQGTPAPCSRLPAMLACQPVVHSRAGEIVGLAFLHARSTLASTYA